MKILNKYDILRLKTSGPPSPMLASAYLLTFCPSSHREGRPVAPVIGQQPGAVLGHSFTSDTDRVSKSSAVMRHPFIPFCIHVTRNQAGDAHLGQM